MARSVSSCFAAASTACKTRLQRVSRRSAEGAADVGGAHRRIVGALIVHAEALLDDLLRLLRRVVAERHGPTPAVAQPASSNVAAIGACARSRALRWVCGCQWHCWARFQARARPLDGAGGPHQCAGAPRRPRPPLPPRAHVAPALSFGRPPRAAEPVSRRARSEWLGLLSKPYIRRRFRPASNRRAGPLGVNGPHAEPMRALHRSISTGASTGCEAKRNSHTEHV